ncbi:MAG: beta-propeller domain-containing protein, partial [Myxococcales bacterium]|nr:beta-propeller domain-containing protein [Myxococcales bacterium]
MGAATLYPDASRVARSGDFYMALRTSTFGLNLWTSIFVLSGLGVALAACSPELPPDDEDQPELDPRILYTFDSCDDLIAHAKEMINEHSGLYDEGYGYGYDDGVTLDGGGETGGGTDGGEPGNGDGGGGAPDFSDTNVQEAGVDEPDLVKTDGAKIMALAKGSLHYVDPQGGSSTLLGSLELGSSDSAQMFLVDDRVLLLDRIYNYNYGGYDGYGGEPGYGGPDVPQAPDVSEWFDPVDYFTVTRVTEIDISDPAAMKVVANLYVGADYVSARKIDVASRVVLRSYPRGLDFKSPWDFIYEWMYGNGGGDGEPGVGSTT